MPTSTLSDSRPWSYGPSLIRRTAVCGPACTVVGQGRRGDSPPYADLGLTFAGNGKAASNSRHGRKRMNLSGGLFYAASFGANAGTRRLLAAIDVTTFMSCQS